MTLESLEPRQLLAVNWRNPVNAVDVTGDGATTPLDALNIVNELNRNGSRRLPDQKDPDRPFWDCTGDQSIAPQDVLQVVNALNASNGAPYQLAEGGGLSSEATVTITVGQTTGSRKYRLRVTPTFDRSDTASSSHDLFAIYLVDPQLPTQTLLDRGLPGTTLFALGEGNVELVPGRVRWDGEIVELDLTEVATRDTARLRLQLLSHDLDTGSRVTIQPLSNTVDPLGAAGQVLLSTAGEPAGPAVSIDELTPAENVTLEVENVRYHAAEDRYAAELRLHNRGTPLARTVAVEFPGLPAGVSLRNPSGTSQGDVPYANFAPAIDSGGLGANARSDALLVEFDVAQGTRFTLAPRIRARANQPPVLAAIEPLTVIVGDKFVRRLNATDPDGDRVTYSLAAAGTGNAAALSLPRGMLSGDGRLEFAPEPDQVGRYTFDVIASDGVFAARQTVTLDVVADPLATTRVSGVVLDIDQSPLAGIRLEVGGVQGLTMADGSFTLDLGAGPPVGDTLKVRGELFTGPVVYPFIAEKLAFILGHEVYAGENNVISRPIFLPPLDTINAESIDPLHDTLVTTNAIPGASVMVKAGTLMNQQGTHFAGRLSITEVPVQRTPAALPNDLMPDLVVTIQPGEMVFAVPAPMTFPNRAGYPAGTLMDLWSINPVTGEFDDVGDMRVSDDARTIVTTSGGVRNSSWHFPATIPADFRAGLVEPSRLGRNLNQGCHSGGCPGIVSGDSTSAAPLSSNVELHSGVVTEVHELVPYRSLDTWQVLTLAYDSQRADPRPIAYSRYLDVAPNSDILAKATARQGDFEFALPGYEIKPGSTGLPDFPELTGNEHFFKSPPVRGAAEFALQFDLSSAPSGKVEVEITTGLVQQWTQQVCLGSTSIAPDGTISCAGGTRSVPRVAGSTDSRRHHFLNVNTIGSPFGSGWGLAGLIELVENPDGSILWIDGDGSELLFDPPGTAGGRYGSPPGEFSSLERLASGIFRRTTKDQLVHTFDANNRLVNVQDRNGNEVRYLYDANGLLSRIIDPVGLQTTFTATGNRITAITDPAGRTTRLEYDTSGNLMQVIDPDGSQRTWEYDHRHHMTRETDQLGRREEIFYDFAGRATHATRKDGSVIRVQPAQTQGLSPPSETTNPAAAKLALDLGPVTSTYVDGNGNVIRTSLDQFGQEISATDDVGPLPTVRRDAQNLVIGRIDARGYQTRNTYDERGNLTRTLDAVSLRQEAVEGSIDYPGEQDRFRFTLDQNARLYFDALSTTFDLRWSLNGPQGPVIVDETFGEGFRFPAPSILELTPGDYSIIIDSPSDTTGPYQFRLLDFTLATPIQPDTPVNSTVNLGTEVEIFQLPVRANDEFLFDVLDQSISGTWRLVDPFGRDVFFGFIRDVFAPPLRLAGNYHLVVEGHTTPNVTYGFSVQLLRNEPAPPPAGTPLEFGSFVERFLPAGQQHSFHFSVTQDTPLYFDLAAGEDSPGASFGPVWTLTGPTGTVVNERRFWQEQSSPVKDLRLPPGNYTLTFRQQSNADMTYGFRMLDLSQAVPLVSGVPVASTSDPAIETDAYRFDATEGERFFFDVSGFRQGNSFWRLIDAFGKEVFSTIFQDVDVITLPTTGSYTLLVEGGNLLAPVRDTGVIPYGFTIHRIPEPGSAAIEVGQRVEGEIAFPGAQERYTVSLPADANLYFDSLTDAPNLQWTLSDAGGSIVAQRRFDNSDAGISLRELRLTAGDYRLTVDGIGDIRGAYSFRLLDLAAAASLVPGTAATGELSPANETDTFRFVAAAGDRYFFDVQSRGDGVGSFTLWRLLDPFGNELFPSSTRLQDVDVIILPRTGTYTLLVEGSTLVAPPPGGRGYTLNVQPVLVAAPAALTLGRTVTGEIATAGEQDRFTFSLASATTLYFDVLAGDSTIQWTLGGSSGTLVSDRTFPNSEPFYSPNEMQAVPGVYTLTVDGLGESTGIYAFRLVDLATAVPLTPGTPVNGALDPAFETDLYRLNAAAGDRVLFDDQSPAVAFNASWRLIDPFGRQIFSSSFGDSGPLVLNTSGQYTLLLEGFDGTGAYTFAVESQGNSPPPPLPTGTPLAIGNTVSGTIDVTGEQDVYRFSLAAPAALYFDTLTFDGNLLWTLAGPAGIAVSQRSLGTNEATLSMRDLRLPAGDYALVVNGEGEASGPYAFRLLDLASAQVIVPGTAVNGELNPASETDLYRFQGNAGDRLFFDQQQSGGGALAHRLIDPFGSNIFGGATGASGFFGDVEVLTLPATGVYTYLVEGPLGEMGRSNYRFNIQPVVDPASTAISVGQSVNGSIGSTGEQDRYTLSLSQPANLYFDSFTDEFLLRWSLDGPGGSLISDRPFSQSDVSSSFSLPSQRELRLPAGNYIFTVDGAGDRTGPYSFRLLDLAAAVPILPKTLVTGMLNPGNATDAYRLEASAGDRFYFDRVLNSFVTWRLLDRFGNTLFTPQVGDVDNVTVQTTGTLTLLMEGRVDVGEAGSFSFVVHPLVDAPQDLPGDALGQRFTYDPVFSQMTSATDEINRQVLYEIDPSDGNRLAATEVVGDVGGADDVITRFTYTPRGLIDTMTDPLGRVTDYDYDPRDRLITVTYAHGTVDQGIVRYEYDAVGNQTAMIDENGNRTQYAYDTMNRLVRMTEADPDGAGPLLSPITRFSYDLAGNMLTVTDARGSVTRYQYDGRDRMVLRTDAIGGAMSWRYDAHGNLTSLTDELGRQTFYGYDARNRLVSTLDPLRGLSLVHYDFDNHPTAFTDENRHTTRVEYDARGRLVRTIDALGQSLVMDYNVADDLVAVTDRNNHTTRYAYDDLARQTSRTDARGGVVTSEYDLAGNRVAVTDELNRRTVFGYDARDRLTTVTNPLGGVLRYDYDAASNLVRTTDELDRVTRYAYDGLNRRVRRTDALNGISISEYDAEDNLVAVTDELNRRTAFSYDPLHRLATVTDPLGHVSMTHYDAAGNVVSFADPLGHTTRYVYDGLNRMVRVTDAKGDITRYEYDPVGNMTRLTDAVGNVTTMLYDALDRLTTETNALGTSRQYEYDPVGNPIGMTDRNGRSRRFDYDELDRPTRERWLDGAGNTIRTFTWTYDAVSQLAAAADPDSMYSLAYDSDGRLASMSNAGTVGVPGVVFTYGYDAVDNRITRSDTVAGQARGFTTYAYDALNRPTRMSESGNGVAEKRVDMAYDAASQMTGVARFADLVGSQAVASSSYTFDAAGRLTALLHARGGADVAHYAWTYDHADRVTRFVLPDGATDYAYDATSQLLTANHTYQPDEVYSFDGNGNRTNAGQSTAKDNRLTSDGTFDYAYDAEGNRTRRTEIATGEVVEYEWDHRNRLTSVIMKTSAGTVIQDIRYTYDVFDRRIAKSVDADGGGPAAPDIERFVYDGDHIVVTFDGAATQTHRYLHGLAVDQILADENAAGQLLWPLTDNLGTIRDLIDSAGTIQNHRRYDSFGQITGESNAASDHAFAFTARELDAETGLYYYRARYYDAVLGRFLSVDPISAQVGQPSSNNAFVYVQNRPTIHVDPSGAKARVPPPPQDANATQAGVSMSSTRGTPGQIPQRLSARPFTSSMGDVSQYTPAQEAAYSRWLSGGLRGPEISPRVRVQELIQAGFTPREIQSLLRQSLLDNVSRLQNSTGWDRGNLIRQNLQLRRALEMVVDLRRAIRTGNLAADASLGVPQAICAQGGQSATVPSFGSRLGAAVGRWLPWLGYGTVAIETATARSHHRAHVAASGIGGLIGARAGGTVGGAVGTVAGSTVGSLIGGGLGSVFGPGGIVVGGAAGRVVGGVVGRLGGALVGGLFGYGIGSNAGGSAVPKGQSEFE